MRKNKWFKMGAGLTAALMLCGSVSLVAFADEVVVDIGGDVVVDVAPEQEIKRLPAEEEDASLAASEWSSEGIAIGTITASVSGDYYTVRVPYSGVDTDVTNQVTIFAYDVTSIFDAEEADAPAYDSASTPVGWINQEVAAESGTLTFKIAKAGSDAASSDTSIAAVDADSTLLIKVGGVGIMPAAKAFSLAGATEGFGGVYGDVDGDEEVTNLDFVVVMQAYMGVIDPLVDDDAIAADVDASGEVDNADAISIMQRYLGVIDSFPVEE